MPPSRAYAGRRGVPAMHTPSAQMGKGRARSGMPSRAPLPARTGRARPRGEREVPGVACPRAPPLPREWGRERSGGRACPSRAPFPRERGGTKREGVGPGAACPCARSFHANPNGGRGERERGRRPVLVRTFCANGQRGQEGRGGAGGNMPSCTRFPRAADRGKSGGGGMPSCATLPRKRGGADGGEGTREAEGVAGACPLSACEGGGGGQCGERGKGASACPLASPFQREWGRGGRRGEEGVSTPNTGGKEGRVVLDPVAEATRACHVSASAVSCAHSGCHHLPPLPVTLPSPPPFPFAVEKRTQEGQAGAPPPPLHRTPPRSRVDRDALGKGAHMKRGGARGHAAPLPLPLPYPLSASPCSRGKVAHEGTPSPPLPPCVPFACGAPSRRRLFSPSPPALPFPLVRAAHFAQKAPIRVRMEGARTRARRPRSYPFPLRATPFARKGGTRGHARPPGLSLPHSARKGGCTRACRPRHLPSPLAAPPRMRGKGAREGTPLLALPFPIWAEGCCTQVRRAAPYAREGGMRGHAIPGPILPHSRGRAGARRHAAPFVWEGAHEAKQGRRGLQCARVHRARTTFSRAVVRLRQNIDVA
ncbi:hypothetical protein EDB84DRAFT_1443223 [Lactarius hengduanensis]|nr:hypothetical protein EDB84DRAFT_1443223 [Lactarius hengduanensis]